jgi:hypothetical protein
MLAYKRQKSHRAYRLYWPSIRVDAGADVACGHRATSSARAESAWQTAVPVGDFLLNACIAPDL